MNPQRILVRAESWKRKAHRLSLDLRLKSAAEARKFLREHGAVLWTDKAELPNLLDATIGRIANARERAHGKPAENCSLWRRQLLQDPDFLECRFFHKLSTVMHQDLWPYVTVFARMNRKRTEEEPIVSREAKKILSFLEKEGPTRLDQLRRALKLSETDSRLVQRAKTELQNLLIVVSRDSSQDGKQIHSEVLHLWDHCVPKTVRSRADQISPKEARLKLLAATLSSCVLSREKDIPRWFAWCSGEPRELIDTLVASRAFLRIEHRKTSWIIPRRILP